MPCVNPLPTPTFLRTGISIYQIWKRMDNFHPFQKEGDSCLSTKNFIQKTFSKPFVTHFLLLSIFFENDGKTNTVSVCNALLHFSNNIKYCILYCIIPYVFLLLILEASLSYCKKNFISREVMYLYDQ